MFPDIEQYDCRNICEVQMEEEGASDLDIGADSEGQSGKVFYEK